LPSFEDCISHPTSNLDRRGREQHLGHPVINDPKSIDKIDCILNNSFGIVDIDSVVLVGRLEKQSRRYYWMANGVYMARKQIRPSIQGISAQVVADEELSRPKGDISIREQIGPNSVDFPGIIMELREPSHARASPDNYIRSATPSSSMAYLGPQAK
jgi:hypothetical protein